MFAHPVNTGCMSLKNSSHIALYQNVNNLTNACIYICKMIIYIDKIISKSSSQGLLHYNL